MTNHRVKTESLLGEINASAAGEILISVATRLSVDISIPVP